MRKLTYTLLIGLVLASCAKVASEPQAELSYAPTTISIATTSTSVVDQSVVTAVTIQDRATSSSTVTTRPKSSTVTTVSKSSSPTTKSSVALPPAMEPPVVSTTRTTQPKEQSTVTTVGARTTTSSNTTTSEVTTTAPNTIYKSTTSTAPATTIAPNTSRSTTTIATTTQPTTTTLQRGLVSTVAKLAPPVQGISFDGSNMWVSEYGNVVKISKATNQILARVPVPYYANDSVFDGTSIWVASSWPGHLANGSVARIDPINNTVLATISVGGAPGQLAVSGDGRIWVTNTAAGLVVIDPSNNTWKQVLVGAYGPVAWDGKVIWAATNDGIVQTNGSPGLNIFGKLPAGAVATNLAGDGNGVWVTYTLSGTSYAAYIDRNSPFTLGTAFGIGFVTRDIIFDGNSMWASSDNILVKFGIHAIGVSDTFGMLTPGQMAWDGSNLWIVSAASGVYRLNP